MCVGGGGDLFTTEYWLHVFKSVHWLDIVMHIEPSIHQATCTDSCLSYRIMCMDTKV